MFSATPADRALAQADTLGTPAADVALAVAASNSSVALAGYTFGSLDGPNAGSADAFVHKYDDKGVLLWADQFGTPLFDFVTGIAVDAAGDVYAAGYTLGSLAGSHGGYDAFLRKYNRNGTVLWTRQFGTADDDRANAISLDPSGNIYIAGTVSDPQGTADVFVSKYNKNGVQLWTRRFGTANDDFGNGVAADRDGNVFVVGYTHGALAGAVQGVSDAFIRKYSPAGAALWTRQFGTSGGEVAVGVATVPAGEVIIAGYTSGSFPGFTNTGGTAVFVRKYSRSGAVVMTDQFGASAPVYANGIAADPGGEFYVTGYAQGDLAGTNAGGFDAFVRKYTRANTVAWTRQFGTPQDDIGFAIAVAPSHKLYVAGATMGALGATNKGSNDAFLRRVDHLNGTAVWTDQ